MPPEVEVLLSSFKSLECKTEEPLDAQTLIFKVCLPIHPPSLFFLSLVSTCQVLENQTFLNLSGICHHKTLFENNSGKCQCHMAQGSQKLWGKVFCTSHQYAPSGRSILILLCTPLEQLQRIRIYSSGKLIDKQQHSEHKDKTHKQATKQNPTGYQKLGNGSIFFSKTECYWKFLYFLLTKKAQNFETAFLNVFYYVSSWNSAWGHNINQHETPKQRTLPNSQLFLPLRHDSVKGPQIGRGIFPSCGFYLFWAEDQLCWTQM